MKRSSPVADWRIIAGIVVALGAAYLIFFGVSRTPQPAAQKDFQHPQIPGVQPGTEPDYSRAIASLPKSYDSLVQMGNHFMDNQVYTLAVECYQRALKIDSTNPDVLTDLGATFYSMGRSDDALQSFQKALAINPNHVIANFNMGIVYRGMNEMAKARPYWQKYLELDPRSPMADTVRKYLDEGVKKQ